MLNTVRDGSRTCADKVLRGKKPFPRGGLRLCPQRASFFHFLFGFDPRVVFASKMQEMVLSKRLGILALVMWLAVVAAAVGRKPQAPTASLDFVIIKDSDGKPVRNAEIVLHPVDNRGHQKDEGLELKTHQDGKAAVTGIPYGKFRIQVIAPGFRTYGEDYDINQPNHEITIKLQKPAEQYSIYK
jgi:hypothetical protein